MKTNTPFWVGDGKHALCCEACAHAYADREIDVDWNGDRFIQLSGRINDDYALEDFDAGECCHECKQPLAEPDRTPEDEHAIAGCPEGVDFCPLCYPEGSWERLAAEERRKFARGREEEE